MPILGLEYKNHTLLMTKKLKNFGAVHTYKAHIREYFSSPHPFPPPGAKVGTKCKFQFPRDIRDNSVCLNNFLHQFQLDERIRQGMSRR